MEIEKAEIRLIIEKNDDGEFGGHLVQWYIDGDRDEDGSPNVELALSIWQLAEATCGGIKRSIQDSPGFYELNNRPIPRKDD